jgi:hypothetical protein
MAQTNFTPISLYYSATAANVPSAANLVAGELAINTQDGKLFYKDAAGVVQTIASKDTNSGTFTNISVSGVATFGAGTVSLPSITTTGDTNTGIFFPAADTIAFAEGGAEAARFDASGNLLLASTSAVTARNELRLGGNNSGSAITMGRSGTNKVNILVDAGDNVYLENNSATPIFISTNGVGRITIPADAGGIQFPATQAPSTNANTLDDYEEGTFTPTWSGVTSGSGTLGTGSYIKIGRFVTVTIVMNDVTFITFVGNLKCSLPFTAGSPGGGAQYLAAPMYYFTGGNWNTGIITAGITPTVSDGDAFMNFSYMLVNGDRQTAVASTNSTLSGANNTYARFSISYFTTS